LGGKYIDYVCKAKYFHRPKFPELFDNEKIIVRGISGENNSLISVYYDNQFYSNHNLIHLILWNDKIMKLQRPTRGWEPYRPFDDFPLLYITGIINSQRSFSINHLLLGRYKEHILLLLLQKI
jgi:hypothetical protein